MIAEVTGEHIAGTDNHLRLSEDLHLDSLGRVQLQSELEHQVGLELEDAAIASVETLGELRALLKHEPGANLSPETTMQIAARIADEATDVPAAAQSAKEKSPVSQAPIKPDRMEPHQTSTTQTSTTRPSRQESKEAFASDHIYPHWPWIWPVRAIRIAFIELVMRPLIWLLAAPRVGRQTHNLPQGPLLIIANHVTAYDGALVLYALPPRLRRSLTIAMAGDMLLDLHRGQNQPSAPLDLLAPIAYWLITALFNVFPLPRQRGFRRSFEHAGEALDHGDSVLIFPEGTRSHDGNLHPFRAGIGLLAHESHVPVLHVALIGLGEMRKTRWFRSGRLQIRIVNPFQSMTKPHRQS